MRTVGTPPSVQTPGIPTGGQGSPCSQHYCPSRVPIPLTMHKSPRLQGPRGLGPFNPPHRIFSDSHNMATVTCSCLCNGRSGDRLLSTWLAPAFQYTLPCCCRGNTHAHVHAATHHYHLLETQKDSRPHPERNGLQACPCHFLVTELITFVRLGFHF